MKIELNKEELEALVKEAVSKGKQVESFKVIWFVKFPYLAEAVACRVELEETFVPKYIFFKCPHCDYEYHPKDKLLSGKPLKCPTCFGQKLEPKEEEGLVEKPKQSMPKRLLVNELPFETGSLTSEAQLQSKTRKE